MEALILIGVVLLVFGPIFFSVAAFRRAGRAEEQARILDARIRALESRPAEPVETVTPVPVTITPTPVFKLVPPPLPPPAAPLPPPIPSSGAMEVAIGGKVASFVGIAIVVAAIVFFVGYAIQNGWIGPTMRVALGLLFGGLLVVAGHIAEVRSDRLQILARALTGGGAALFYFTLFAAHGIYHLIGPWTAGVGLIACAAVVFALAALYRSQAVAIIGYLGAVLTPPLIHGQLDRGLFPMLYLAAINVPVILRGHRRAWQILYNLALLATALLVGVWLEREARDHVTMSYLLSAFFFLEFAGLSLLRVGATREPAGRGVDLARQAATGLLLLGALFWISEAAHHHAWRGALFIAAAVANILLARSARIRAGSLKDEALGFLIIALTFASLALPAQLDGAWVSLGWGIEGALLCWFGLRLRSPALQGGAFLLALLGLGKSMGYDLTLFDNRPTSFANSRFVVGLLSAGLLFLQGWLHARHEKREPPRPASAPVSDLLHCAGILAILAAALADALFTATISDAGPWFYTSLVLAAAAVGATIIFPSGRLPFALGVLLLLALPAKLLVDTAFGWDAGFRHDPGFVGSFWWMRLVLIGAACWWYTRLPGGVLLPTQVAPGFYLIAFGSAILLVSRELAALRTDWADSGLTVFWAACALALVAGGWMRRRAYLRYAGLALFGVTVAKVMLVDLADLRGLQRVAALLGAGVLLLVLSFVYQKVAPLLTAGGERKS